MNSKVFTRLAMAGLGLVALGAVHTPVAAAGAANAKQENFRFAIPEHYAVVEHRARPSLRGASALFAPSETVDVKERILHLQTYLSEYYPESLSALAQDQPREFMNLVLNTELEKACNVFTLDSGKIRKRNGGVRINWWTSCQLKSDPAKYRFERGRMFLANSGGYFISHINLSQNKDHKFKRQEIHWFDKYLFNSGLCVKGVDCGKEGALVNELFIEK